MAALPHCDNLFLHYFDRWYNDADRLRKEFPATRPDMLNSSALIGLSQDKASPLESQDQQQVWHRIETMLEAAREDWPQYLQVSGEISLQWITVFDKYYRTNRIQAVIKRSDPSDYSNDYLVICCEFGAVLGHVLRTLQPRLIWSLDWPYWESALLDPKTGNLIPVFHWAIKKMSGYGWDDGFAEKVTACLQLLNEGSEA